MATSSACACCRGYAGREPAEHLEPARVALLLFRGSGTSASGCHRSAFCGNLKPSGITPMTTDGMSLTRIVRPTIAGIAAVAVLPDAAAEQHDRRRRLGDRLQAGSRGRGPAPGRCSLNALAETNAPLKRSGARPSSLTFMVAAGVGGQRRERLRRGAPVLEVEVGDAHVAIAHRIARAERHDPIGIVERQPANQDGVDEGEDRGIHADAESQRDGGDEREPLVLDEQTDRELKVLPEAHADSLNQAECRCQTPTTQNRAEGSHREEITPSHGYTSMMRFAPCLSVLAVPFAFNLA